MKRILFLLLIYVQVGVAQNRLSIEDCRKMALEASYNLKSSSQRVLMAEDMLAAYKTNYLPNFSITGNYLYSTSSLSATIEGGLLPVISAGVVDPYTFAYMPDMEYNMEVGSVFNVGAMVKQPLYMGGRIVNAVRLAALGIELSTLDKRKSEVEVMEMADNAFYKVVELEETLLSAQKYEGVVAEFLRQMQSAHNQGLKTKNDLLKVGVRLNEAKLLVLKAENGVRLSKMNLCYVVGLPLSTDDISLVEGAAQEQSVDSRDLDVSRRPEYAMLEKQVEAKELESSVTRGEFLPTISAIATYGYTNGVKINDAKLLNSASFTGGVMMDIPIFHWGEGRRKRRAKDREVSIAQNQMSDLTQQMTLELMHSINGYNESILEVKLAQYSVDQASENMRQSLSQFNAGMETLADHLEAQALWQAAMGELCAAKSKHRLAYTQYLKCRGAL